MNDLQKKKTELFNVFTISARIVNILFILKSSVFMWFIYFSIFIAFKGSTSISGNVVDCIIDVNKDKQEYVEAVNRWCLSHGLYVLANDSAMGNYNSEVKYRLKYYFWIPYILLLHAVVMNLTAWIRKVKEGGMMDKLLNYFITHGLLAASPSGKFQKPEKETSDKKPSSFGESLFKAIDDNRKSSNATGTKTNDCKGDGFRLDMSHLRNQALENLADVLERRMRENCNIEWAFSLIGCEILSILIELSMVYYYDYLLSGKYNFLGLEAFTDLNEVFPLTAKCDYFQFGPSGSLLKRDALCVLSQNFNYKLIFFILWWFNFIFVIGGSAVLFWRLIEAALFHCDWYLYCFGFAKEAAQVKIVKRISYWDFIFLKYLKSNVGDANFWMLLQMFKFHQKLDEECIHKIDPPCSLGSMKSAAYFNLNS